MVYLDLSSNVLPFTTALYRWKQVKENYAGAALVFTFTTLGAFTEAVTFWMAIHRIENLWVLHVYHLGEYILLMSLFGVWQKESEAGTVSGQRPQLLLLRPN